MEERGEGSRLTLCAVALCAAVATSLSKHPHMGLTRTHHPPPLPPLRPPLPPPPPCTLHNLEQLNWLDDTAHLGDWAGVRVAADSTHRGTNVVGLDLSGGKLRPANRPALTVCIRKLAAGPAGHGSLTHLELHHSTHKDRLTASVALSDFFSLPSPSSTKAKTRTLIGGLRSARGGGIGGEGGGGGCGAGGGFGGGGSASAAFAHATMVLDVDAAIAKLVARMERAKRGHARAERGRFLVALYGGKKGDIWDRSPAAAGQDARLIKQFHSSVLKVCTVL